eukprot:1605198-Pyramimonas_sp.AAC.1
MPSGIESHCAGVPGPARCSKCLGHRAEHLGPSPIPQMHASGGDPPQKRILAEIASKLSGTCKPLRCCELSL